jgi:hypothetical protein
MSTLETHILEVRDDQECMINLGVCSMQSCCIRDWRQFGGYLPKLLDLPSGAAALLRGEAK